MTDKTDRNIARQLAAALDARADGLDASTRSRLNRARQAALAAAPTRRRIGPWLAGAGVAAAAVLATVLWLGQPAPVPLPGEVLSGLGIEVFEDDLELVEDLDFYEWLEQAETGQAEA